VHATVMAGISGGVIGRHNGSAMTVPGFRASLVDHDNIPRFSSESDAYGRLSFSNIPQGAYRLCWNDTGWISGCAPSVVQVQSGLVVVPAIDVEPSVVRDKDGKVLRGPIWGRVTLSDGSVPYVQNTYLNIHLTAEVYVQNDKGDFRTSNTINSDGYFLLTDVPAEISEITAVSGNAATTVPIRESARGGGGTNIQFDFAPPEIGDVGGEPIFGSFVLGEPQKRRVRLTLGAPAHNASLSYEWRPAPGSGRMILSNGPTAVWEPAPYVSRQSVYVIARNSEGAIAWKAITGEVGLDAFVLSPTCPSAPPNPPPSGPGAVTPGSDFFLSYYQNSEADAESYYTALDPAMQFTKGGWSGGTHSNFKDWLAQAGFTSTAPAGTGIDHVFSEQVGYLNFNDLGFGRRMTMRVDKNGTVFAFVTNFGGPTQCLANADDANNNNSKSEIATVAMEFSPLGGIQGNLVKFFIYSAPTSDPAMATLQNGADLDGHGVKYVPNLCVSCHGGSPVATGSIQTPQTASLRYDLNNQATGAHFREFDLASFRYPKGTPVDSQTNVPSDSALLDKFKRLNEFSLQAAPTKAISEIVNLWYNNPQKPYDSAAFPTGWATHPDLYSGVVAKSCRTCHVAFGDTFDWASYSVFQLHRGTIKNFVCNGPATRQMAQALITYVNFWDSAAPKPPDILGKFSASDWQSFGACN
jgi:hypothetical protein